MLCLIILLSQSVFIVPFFMANDVILKNASYKTHNGQIEHRIYVYISIFIWKYRKYVYKV